MESMVSLLIVGFMIVVIALASLVIFKATNDNNRILTEYDERQEAVRGRGFKYALYTNYVLSGIFALLYFMEVNLPADPAVIILVIFLVSAFVQVTYAIWNDAYFGQNSNIRKYTVVFAVLGLINLVAFVAFAKEGMIIENGVITFRVINGALAFFLLIMGIEVVIKRIVKKEDSEESEED